LGSMTLANESAVTLQDFGSNGYTFTDCTTRYPFLA